MKRSPPSAVKDLSFLPDRLSRLVVFIRPSGLGTTPLTGQICRVVSSVLWISTCLVFPWLARIFVASWVTPQRNYAHVGLKWVLSTLSAETITPWAPLPRSFIFGKV